MELLGLEYGARDNGCSSCGNYIKRAIVLANAPGDLKDFVYILLRYRNIAATIVLTVELLFPNMEMFCLL